MARPDHNSGQYGLVNQDCDRQKTEPDALEPPTAAGLELAASHRPARSTSLASEELTGDLSIVEMGGFSAEGLLCFVALAAEQHDVA